jgi:two-component system response regulator HydG
MTNGARSGAHFLLDPSGENRVGRGTDCHIILTDPLCSRVHCVLERRDGSWWIRDTQSRNGTYVNNQKIDEAQLQPGASIRVGSAEFKFQESPSRPSNSGRVDLNLTQTIVRDAPIKPLDPFQDGFLRDGEQAADLFILHQLTIRLLGTVDPSEVVRISLDLLRDRMKASVASFLWMSDDGLLKLKEVLPPEDAAKIDISEQLTDMVLHRKHAVWVNNQRRLDESRVTGHYADAICVPLMREEELLGAVHLYRGL